MTRILMVLRNICVFVVIFLITPSAFANLEATVDRSQVSMGETIELILSSTQNSAEVINSKPELSPLEKDFSIVGSSKRSQLSVINGEASRLTEWVITLMPLRSGDITIPSLQLGAENSAAIKIQVLSVAQATEQKKLAPVFLEVSVDNRTPFVQQQVNYIVRLYYAERLVDGEMTDPQAKNALILRVGADKSSQVKKEGKLYQVLERRYIVFPQSSGEIKIMSPEFSGAIESRQISTSSAQYNPFFIGMNKPLRLVAPSEILQVKAIPPKANNGSDAWLPARKISLTESWSQPLSQWRVGQPVTRTLLLEAEGLSSTQLPSIPVAHPNGVNHYADKEETDTALQGDMVVGRRIEKIVYIPLQAGDIEFPEVTIAWWNTDLHRIHRTSIASKTAHVLQGANGSNVATNNNNSATTAAILPNTSATNNELKNNAPELNKSANIAVDKSTTNIKFALLPWLLAAFFASLWIVTLYKLRRNQMTQLVAQQAAQNGLAHQQQTKKKWQKQLKQACFAGDYSQAKECLIAWSKINWPESLINSLSDISQLAKYDELNNEIDRLNAVLYGAPAETIWRGEALWQAFIHFTDNRQASAKNDSKGPHKNALPNLYLND